MKRITTLIVFAILALTAKAQIPNNGFETLNSDNNVSQWSKAFLTVIWIDSTGESHGDSIVFDSPNQALYLPSTDAHSGQYALEMRNAYNYTSTVGIAGGAVLTQDDGYSIGFEVPVPVSPILPETFHFYYKYFPLASDSAHALAKLYDVDGIEIGEASLTIGGTVSDYTLAAIPITYSEIRPVEYISISFLTAVPGSEPTFGTRFLVDDVSFDGTLGLNELKESPAIYPNPANSGFQVDGLTGDETLKIFNLMGEGVDLTYSKTGEIDCSAWENGVYLLQILRSTGIATSRVVVSH